MVRGRFEKAGAESVATAAYNLATRALQEGQRTYCPELVKASGLAGALDTWGVAIDAIEGARLGDEGASQYRWQLVHWAVDAAGVGRPVFRRVAA